MPMGPKPKPIAERFWPRVEKRDADECWEWKGSRLQKGYGTMPCWPFKRPALAHRVSWEIHNGNIPDGLIVCHRCDNPPCVNPAHLFLGSHQDNLRDMVKKGRQVLGDGNPALANRLKTECKHGHPFSPENTMWIVRRGAPARRCRTCDRASVRATRLRKIRAQQSA